MTLKHISLDAPHKFRGKWWPAAYPDDKRHGEFYFIPEGPSKLDLHESFESLQDEHGMVTILGESKGSNRLSLLSCFRTFRDGSLVSTGFEFSSESYTVNRALVGGEAKDHEDDTQYYCLEMRVDYLEEWTGITSFEPVTDKDQQHAITSVKLRDSLPITCQVDAINADFSIDSSYSTEFIGMNQFCWKRSSVITLTPSNPQTLDWFSSQASLVQSFFSLLIGHLVHTSQLTLRGDERQMLPDISDRSAIDVLYHRKGAPISRACNHPALMLMRYIDIGEKLQEMLNAWFHNYALLNLPIQILWSVQGGGYSYKESEFIAITQAVEAFSRARGDGLYLSKEEWVPFYESMKATIPQELSDDNRKSLDNRLLYGNEFSLSKRLTILIRGLPEGVQDLIAPDGVSKFVRAIVDTRNQLTHREHGEDYALTGIELVRANLRLQLLLVLLALQEIGVPDEQLNPAAQRCEYFRMIVPRN